MTSATNRAQPALDFIPPNYSPLLRRAIQPLMPAWTSWKTDLAEVETRNVETLAKLYQEFDAGKTRLMLAFRHPSTTDPYVLSYLLWRSLPKKARELGIKINQPHAHFLYDRGIPLWAGQWLGGLFSRLGGIPIQRGKLDLLALKTARRLLLEGKFPLAAAPEGGTNGHNEIVSPLEPGIAQMGFWCAEDLQAKNRTESVVILPIGIQYRYLEEPWKPLDNLIGQMEADSGLKDDKALDLYGRLYRLAEHLLTMMEGYYTEFYGVVFDEVAPNDEPNKQLGARLRVLMDEALKVAEQYFGLRPKGSMIDRCRRLEQAGWDRVFREDTENLFPVELGLANRVAEEADLRIWHMHLVESFVAVTGHYVKEHPSADRFAETALLLRDMIDKIKGEPVSQTQLGPQRAIATIGNPIVVSERYSDYQKKRRRAIATLTADLQAEMERLIISE
ncbi:MAG: 1-acyl-sn-glycerol-3-phosphate acyltransferase [Cyanobacteria bacterium J06621_3]